MTDDKAPARDKETKPAKKPAAGAFASFKVIQDGLESTLVGIGVFVSPFDDFCGPHLIQQGPVTAAALTEAAKQNPTLKAILFKFVQTSTMAQVVGALGALLVPIAAHHGLLPGSITGAMGGAPEGVGMEAGGAPDPDWANQFGQDNPGPSDPPPPKAQPRARNKTSRSPAKSVPGPSDGEDVA